MQLAFEDAIAIGEAFAQAYITGKGSATIQAATVTIADKKVTIGPFTIPFTA